MCSACDRPSPLELPADTGCVFEFASGTTSSSSRGLLSTTASVSNVEGSRLPDIAERMRLSSEGRRGSPTGASEEGSFCWLMRRTSRDTTDPAATGGAERAAVRGARGGRTGAARAGVMRTVAAAETREVLERSDADDTTDAVDCPRARVDTTDSAGVAEVGRVGTERVAAGGGLVEVDGDEVRLIDAGDEVRVIDAGETVRLIDTGEAVRLSELGELVRLTGFVAAVGIRAGTVGLVAGTTTRGEADGRGDDCVDGTIGILAASGGTGAALEATEGGRTGGVGAGFLIPTAVVRVWDAIWATVRWEACTF